MLQLDTKYDAVIIGAGHNGLVAAAYLGRAGLSVLVLERDAEIGGATRSSCPFPGVDAQLSVYSYLISLFPEKIVKDLGLNLNLKSRAVASYTPQVQNGNLTELLISNTDPKVTRDSFHALPGGAADYRGYLHLQELQARLARRLWPTLLSPLRAKADLMAQLDATEREAWDALVENPLGNIIEAHLENDLIRGLVFTDAKIGVSTYPHDPSLLQNLTYLYHVIGRETGEWCVPVGGMGALTHWLKASALASCVTTVTSATVEGIHLDGKRPAVTFSRDGISRTLDADFVLCNAAPTVLDRLKGNTPSPPGTMDEGSVLKINMLLKRLPQLRSESYSPEEGFGGTFHIDEGYDRMTAHYLQAAAGQLAEQPSGEVYCHSLTDPSILPDELQQQGYHTLTLFGLDMPYAIFETDNDRLRSRMLEKYLSGINQYTREPIQDCIAEDANGDWCVDIKTPVDLERELHLPRGNIFHNALRWPFAETSEAVGTWGVETDHPRVFLCGSGAHRGGAVSGIPGHNAAMKVISLS